MHTFMERFIDQLIRLINVTGYLLMLVLSLTLWWGIYSGVDITLKDQSSRNSASSAPQHLMQSTVQSATADEAVKVLSGSIHRQVHSLWTLAGSSASDTRHMSSFQDW